MFGGKGSMNLHASRRKEDERMKTLGYYNGRYDEIDRMMIPMNDRVCYFGDGVYDAQPCRNHHLFALDEHSLDRIDID